MITFRILGAIMLIDDLNSLLTAPKDFHIVPYGTGAEIQLLVDNPDYDFAYQYDGTKGLYQKISGAWVHTASDLSLTFFNKTTGMDTPIPYYGIEINGEMDLRWPPNLEDYKIYVVDRLSQMYDYPHVRKGEIVVAGEASYILGMWPQSIRINWAQLLSINPHEGSWWGKSDPTIDPVGVQELGKTLDFHCFNLGPEDYTFRLINIGDGDLLGTGNLINKKYISQAISPTSGGKLILAHGGNTDMVADGASSWEFFAYNTDLLINFVDSSSVVTNIITLGQNAFNIKVDLNLDGNLHVTKTTTIDNTLHVLDNVTFDKRLSVTGNTNISGTLGVTDATTLSNTLHLVGNGTFDSNLQITGLLNVTGSVTLNNILHVVSDVTFDSILSVAGATSLNNTLYVTGQTTLDNTLDVTGATTLNSTLHLVGNATFDSNLSVGNLFTVTGGTTLNNTLHLVGAGTFDNTLIVSGGTTLSSTLHQVGDATFDNNIAVSGNAAVSGTLSVTGTSTLSSTLDVTGKITGANGLQLSGGVFTGNGSGITNLNGSNISSGTVPFARLPTGTSSTTVAIGNHTHDSRYPYESPYQYINNNYTANNGDRLLVDTSAWYIAITLPSSPSIGQTVQIVDAMGTFNSYYCYVSGGTIRSSASATVYLQTVNSRTTFVYVNSSRGWIYF